MASRFHVRPRGPAPACARAPLAETVLIVANNAELMPLVDRGLLHSRAGRVAVGFTAALVIATAVALAVMWPSGGSGNAISRLLFPGRDHAQVTAVRHHRCVNANFRDCRRVVVRLLTGGLAGSQTYFDTGEDGFVPSLEPGDRVSVYRKTQRLEGGVPAGQLYQLGDPERHKPLLWLVLAFALVAAVLGRRRGVLALVGLGISLAVVFTFIVPAMIEGTAPAAVALAGGVAVMLATTLVAHGITAKSTAAVLGTMGALVVTCVLAVIFTSLADLTGFTSTQSGLLVYASHGTISLEGLVLAGTLIGALGVLDDVTVSQASAVLALRRANPTQRARELYDGALGVGRDHVSAAVNTLVLAYVGSSLPILLVFSVSNIGVSGILDREDVAEEVVSTLVGSIGLLAAVPITTALAVLLATRLPTEALGEGDAHDGHAH
jgi:uncharacterized membrane protein